MQAFQYYAPTRVLFGPGIEEKTGDTLQKAGASRVLMVYGGGSVKRSGLFDRVRDSLTAHGIASDEYGGAKPNPTLQTAVSGVAKAVRFGADFILAVGGGSAIDTAKAIAVGAKHPTYDLWDDIWLRKKQVTTALPIGVVLTLSATGSEMSNNSVLTNEATNQKMGHAGDYFRPAVAFLNPELTFTVPKKEIGNGVVDIMMHTLDRYFSPVQGNHTTDAIAEALLRQMVQFGPIALQNPSDYEAASEIMWCGSLSHNDLTGLGGNNDMTVHKIAAPLSAIYDSAHGATLSAMWPSWARYVVDRDPARFQKLGEAVFGLTYEGMSDKEAALASILAFEDFFRSIEMPTNYTELGIGILAADELKKMADLATSYGERTLSPFRTLSRDDVLAIHRMANR